MAVLPARADLHKKTEIQRRMLIYHKPLSARRSPAENLGVADCIAEGVGVRLTTARRMAARRKSDRRRRHPSVVAPRNRARKTLSELRPFKAVIGPVSDDRRYAVYTGLAFRPQVQSSCRGRGRRLRLPTNRNHAFMFSRTYMARMSVSILI